MERYSRLSQASKIFHKKRVTLIYFICFLRKKELGMNKIMTFIEIPQKWTSDNWTTFLFLKRHTGLADPHLVALGISASNIALASC